MRSLAIRRSLGFLLLATLFAACAEQSGVRPGAPSVDERRVDVTHLDNGRFAVAVTLPEPIEEWVFHRTPAIDLREQWVWTSPGARLEKRGKRDVVVVPDAVRTLRFEVVPDDRFVRADYSLSQTFLEDAGTVLYTGHFAADEQVSCATDEQERAPCVRQRPTRTRLTPSEDEWLWFASHYAASPIEWLDEHMQGSMAYFGNERPVEQAGVQMLLDPNLPGWMREDLLRFMPELVAIYQRQYGQRLSFTPRLLFSFGGGDPNRTSLYGGVVDRMVQLSVLGDIWLEPSDEARQRYLYLLAHEAAHLWNGAQFNHDHSEGTSWLHEGNADAMAWRAGIELGLYQRADVWRLRTSALESCLTGATEALNEAGRRGRFDRYYSCGAIIDLLAEGALRIEGRDAAAQWREMFIAIDGVEYSQDTYLSSLRRLVDDRDIPDLIERWADRGLDSADVLLDALQRVGVRIGTLSEASADSALYSALGHVLRQDCPNGYALHQTPDRIAIRGGSRCQVLPAEWFDVLAFGGVARSLTAVRLIEAACAEASPLILSLRDEAGVVRELTLPCDLAFEYRTLDGWRAPELDPD